ncbi:hypothetical protein SU48_12130 [Deinococcus puniceus]|uniref:Uncharacterized protein n=1 Tax=Deinococcus puniceus TaxID=1182568 RepID=A0A172TBS7_9DEIO|nr:hypothetical protein SU48_12130 [Deinococcus puniceus]
MFRWTAGLSIAAASMVIPTFVVIVGLGMGASGAEGVPDWLLLSFFLFVATWIAFGLVALRLADSWKTGLQIIGWGVLCAVLCLVPGLLLLFGAA